MRTYRLSKTKYVEDLSGTGAKNFPGRWNLKDVPMLYTSESRALAALEVLVHIPARKILDPYSFVVLEFPDELAIGEVLPKYPEFADLFWLKENEAFTQVVGTFWAVEAKTVLLKVPSIIIPGEFNYVLNPTHPDFATVQIVETFEFLFDERLI